MRINDSCDGHFVEKTSGGINRYFNHVCLLFKTMQCNLRFDGVLVLLVISRLEETEGILTHTITGECSFFDQDLGPLFRLNAIGTVEARKQEVQVCG